MNSFSDVWMLRLQLAWEAWVASLRVYQENPSCSLSQWMSIFCSTYYLYESSSLSLQSLSCQAKEHKRTIIKIQSLFNLKCSVLCKLFINFISPILLAGLCGSSPGSCVHGVSTSQIGVSPGWNRTLRLSRPETPVSENVHEISPQIWVQCMNSNVTVWKYPHW